MNVELLRRKVINKPLLLLLLLPIYREQKIVDITFVSASWDS